MSTSAVHKWIRSLFGIAKKCELCGRVRKKTEGKNKFEWSNKSGQYLRDTKDWWQLCKPCHTRYDGIKVENREHGNVAKYRKEGCRCDICAIAYFKQEATHKKARNRTKNRSIEWKLTMLKRRLAAARLAAEKYRPNN